jgi:hypothetical protein
MNIQKTEYECADKNNQQTDNRKKFNQPERFYFIVSVWAMGGMGMTRRGA